MISIHALLAESDILGNPCAGCPAEFLSTLSLRRATPSCCITPFTALISIHALLAESDTGDKAKGQMSFISIHALLAESDTGDKAKGQMSFISIHALLAESDRQLIFMYIPPL